MENVTRTFRALFPVLLSVVLLASCVKEMPIDGPGSGPGTGDEEKIVSFSLRVPAASNPATRALTETEENEVNNVTVLALNPETGNVFKHETPTGTTSPTPTKRVFEITLPVGNYNLVVIANANEFIRTKYPNGIARGTHIDAVQSALVIAQQESDMSKTGDREADKWNTTVNEAKGYLLPMWGQLSDVTVTPAETPQDIGTVNLYRMVSKIELRIPRTDKDDMPIITEQNFTLKEVTFHNYNTKGQIVPVYANGTWEASPNKASAPSLLPIADNFVTGHDKYQFFNAFTEVISPETEQVNPGGVNTELTGMIYTFEADKGSDYQTRPCVIFGGSYEGGETTYYRVDFIKSETSDYLDLLRNHRYIIYVKKISGPGYGSVEEAYYSKPINLEAEVIPWNESEYLEGVWNSNYYIKFSTLSAHFTQFGEPTPQVISIKTNCADLKLGNFENVENVDGDGTWTTTEAAEGRWTNDHFTVVSVKKASSGAELEYTLTISALSANMGDNERIAKFRIKALNLDAMATISQDPHTDVESIAPRFARSNIVWDGENEKLTFAVTSGDNATIPANSQGVFFKWGSLVAINPVGAYFSTSSILFSPTGTQAYYYDQIPYAADETADLFHNDVLADDDFSTYNDNKGYNALTGVGDICRYISARDWVDGGEWRLPTAAEMGELLNEGQEGAGTYGDYSNSDDSNGFNRIRGGWFFGYGASYSTDMANPQYGIFVPASGNRNTNNNMGSASSIGYLWSGSSSDNSGSDNSGSDNSGYAMIMVGDNEGGGITYRAAASREFGYPVRCIRVQE